MRQRLWALMALIVLATSCGVFDSGPPGQYADPAKALEESIEAAQATVDTAETRYEAQTDGPAFTSTFLGYTDEQLRIDRFDQARSLLNEAATRFEQQIQEPLDNHGEQLNDESETNAFQANLAEIDAMRQEALSLADEPLEWARGILDIKGDTERYISEAQAALAGLSFDTGPVDAAQDEFPDQANRIAQMVQPYVAAENAATEAMATLEDEAAKADPNYAIMLAAHETVLAERQSVDQGEAQVHAQLAELSIRETRTLVDVQVDYEVYISRTTWNNSDNGERNLEYPPVIVTGDNPEATAMVEYLASKVGDRIGRFEGKEDFRLDDGMKPEWWQMLGLDANLQFPGRDRDGEMYVDEIAPLYCWQVQGYIDGQPSAANRPDVDDRCSQYNNQEDLAAGLFWLEEDFVGDLGMDIYAKGYGDFAADATTEPSPPGIVYVGDPDTGEWQTDSNGNEFWAFYGRYAFFSNMIGGSDPYYYRGESRDWNQNHRYGGGAYYGTRGGSPRFGNDSPGAASRFPNSTFNTSGAANSVRSAGPAARGGGPGGGGK